MNDDTTCRALGRHDGALEYHDGFTRANTYANLKKMIRNEYGIFNGVAITVKSSHAGVSLAAVPGVKNVGVIDSGIDYKHPAFAAPGVSEGYFARYGKNCRVKHGWDFVGDTYRIEGTPPLFPWVGVAPEVTFGVYRIFACEGRTGTDSILAAMELAFNDGLDIINMSFNGSPANNSIPMTVLGEKLIAHGMSIVACAGNYGGDEVWMVADVALGDSATSVASFNNAFYILMSSYGVDGDLRSKPDIGAPVGHLHVDPLLRRFPGIALPVHKAWTLLSQFPTRLQNTITSAHDAPNHIDLLDSDNLHKTQKVTIKNIGKKTETFTLSYVKIAAGKSDRATLTFTESKNGDAKQFPLYSGFVVATPSTEGSPSVHVPYIGFKGDAHQVPIIDTDLGFPILTATQANGTMIDIPHKDFHFHFKTAAPIVRYGSHTLTAPSVSTALPPNSSLDTFTPPGGVFETTQSTTPVRLNAA
ncbi:hypothetical protein BGX24_000639 [Mortierella sp. AD032]|nr:hypothetical protein BGX24_000639 [Mortierella sp. AD032]